MEIIVYLIECSVCLSIFFLFYRTVLQSQTSYQFNRWYLLGTLALSIIFPLLEIPIRIGNVPVYQMSGGYLLLNPYEVNEAVTATPDSAWSWEVSIAALYGVGVLMVGIYYIRQITRIIQLVKSKPPTVSTPIYRLVYTDGQFPTASFLNYLLWDNTQTLSLPEQQQMMAHEECHIRQKHSYDILYITLLKTIFWFHPLIYWYEKALNDNHEFAADKGALQQTSSDRPVYVRLLAKQTVHPVAQVMVNHFYKSRTLKRIKMMENNCKTPWYRLASAIPVVAVLFFFFSCQQDAAELERESIQQSHLKAELEWEEIRKLQSDLVAKYFDEHLKDKGNDDLFYQEVEAFKKVATPTELQRYNELRTLEEQAWKRKMAPDTDNVFMVVENQPEPEGGIEKFYQYISTNLKYPTQARTTGVEGKVFVQFVVDTDGSLTEVQTIKGIGAGCDAEAERVIRESIPWNPGEQRGKFVKVRMVLPITFRLGD